MQRSLPTPGKAVNPAARSVQDRFTLTDSRHQASMAAALPGNGASWERGRPAGRRSRRGRPALGRAARALAEPARVGGVGGRARRGLSEAAGPSRRGRGEGAQGPHPDPALQRAPAVARERPCGARCRGGDGLRLAERRLRGGRAWAVAGLERGALRPERRIGGKSQGTAPPPQGAERTRNARGYHGDPPCEDLDLEHARGTLPARGAVRRECTRPPRAHQGVAAQGPPSGDRFQRPRPARSSGGVTPRPERIRGPPRPTCACAGHGRIGRGSPAHASPGERPGLVSGAFG